MSALCLSIPGTAQAGTCHTVPACSTALLRLRPRFLLIVLVTTSVCRMISSSVGDGNHARFLIYCCAQGFYIFWGCLVAWHDATPCYNAFRLSDAVSTRQVGLCIC